MERNQLKASKNIVYVVYKPEWYILYPLGPRSTCIIKTKFHFVSPYFLLIRYISRLLKLKQPWMLVIIRGHFTCLVKHVNENNFAMLLRISNCIINHYMAVSQELVTTKFTNLIGWNGCWLLSYRFSHLDWHLDQLHLAVKKLQTKTYNHKKKCILWKCQKAWWAKV